MHECITEIQKARCGCTVARCSVCGAAQSVSKCDLHKPKEHDSRSYYLTDLHGQSQGIPRHTKVCAELEVALGDMKLNVPMRSPATDRVLEVGAGIGIYAPLFMQRGYAYEAVEADPWACRYIQGAYGPCVHNIKFEDFTEEYVWSAIMAAHVLEHFDDAKAMLEKMFRILKPRGRLYLIIPDDRDLGNPDHKWFFTEKAIRQWMEETGFIEVATCQKQVVIWEDFIYAVGVKPDAECCG